MRKKVYREEQIVGILKECEAGLTVSEVSRKYGVGHVDDFFMEEEVWRHGKHGY